MLWRVARILLVYCMEHEMWYTHIDGLAQDCSNSIALAMELQQSCAVPSICCECIIWGFPWLRYIPILMMIKTKMIMTIMMIWKESRLTSMWKWWIQGYLNEKVYVVRRNKAKIYFIYQKKMITIIKTIIIMITVMMMMFDTSVNAFMSDTLLTLNISSDNNILTRNVLMNRSSVYKVLLRRCQKGIYWHRFLEWGRLIGVMGYRP